MKVLTVQNCYIYEVCFFDGFLKYNYVWSIIMDSSINDCGPVIMMQSIGLGQDNGWFIPVVKNLQTIAYVLGRCNRRLYLYTHVRMWARFV